MNHNHQRRNGGSDEHDATGAVLGIDVGYSATKRSTAICLLSWDATSIAIQVERVDADPIRRAAALLKVIPPGTGLLAAALDGPLTHGLGLVSHYRSAEALLSRGSFQRRGKPGQTSSGTGRKLHSHATDLANLLISYHGSGCFEFRRARHFQPIHDLAIVEAFPNMFLGALIPEPSLPALRRDASDRYWDVLTAGGGAGFAPLLNDLLPGRTPVVPFAHHRDHDDRAGIVCALTALAVGRNRYAGVGDPNDGEIMLPSPDVWGGGAGGGMPWMEAGLRKSIVKVRSNPRSHANHGLSRVTRNSAVWIP
ncbi:MAG: hypothetical protein H6807_13935 [Planctomycetes bacterium]|nr:hypothetical protein [Planctomycetota bacterium]